MKTGRNKPRKTETVSGDRRSHPVSATELKALLTISDVAILLKVSTKQVGRYIAEPERHKRLRAIRIGRLVRIDPADLEDFLHDRLCR